MDRERPGGQLPDGSQALEALAEETRGDVGLHEAGATAFVERLDPVLVVIGWRRSVICACAS
ncbi:MAG: hypothetical protein AAF799_47985 [Myxococcota bacterium]